MLRNRRLTVSFEIKCSFDINTFSAIKLEQRRLAKRMQIRFKLFDKLQVSIYADIR